MITANEEKCYTEFVVEDYFPIIVSANDYIDNISYIEYSCDNNSLLEFTVNKTCKQFYRVKLILCKKFVKQDESMTLPVAYTEGTVLMDVPEKNVPETLTTTVYLDGVEIHLSDKDTKQYYKNGDIFFGIDANGELCNVMVSGLSKTDVEHVLKELRYQVHE